MQQRQNFTKNCNFVLSKTFALFLYVWKIVWWSQAASVGVCKSHSTKTNFRQLKLIRSDQARTHRDRVHGITQGHKLSITSWKASLLKRDSNRNNYKNEIKFWNRKLHADFSNSIRLPVHCNQASLYSTIFQGKVTLRSVRIKFSSPTARNLTHDT